MINPRHAQWAPKNVHLNARKQGARSRLRLSLDLLLPSHTGQRDGCSRVSRLTVDQHSRCAGISNCIVNPPLPSSVNELSGALTLPLHLDVWMLGFHIDTRRVENCIMFCLMLGYSDPARSLFTQSPNALATPSFVDVLQSACCAARRLRACCLAAGAICRQRVLSDPKCPREADKRVSHISRQTRKD